MRVLYFLSLLALPVFAAPELVIPIDHLPKAIDPHLGNDIPLNKIARQVFETVVGQDEGLNPVPLLAKRWEVDRTQSSIRFYLDPSHRFSDGQPITARDVLNSFIRSQQRGNLVVTQLQAFGDCVRGKPCAGFRVVNDSVFDVRIDGGNLPLLFKKLSSMDGSIVRESGHELLGSGPFSVASVTAAGVRLKRRAAPLNPRSIEQMFFRRVSFADSQVLFQRGEIHEIDNISFQYPTQAPRGAQLLQNSLPATYFLALNLRKKPFNDRNARQAFAQALDRVAFLQGLGVEGAPCHGVIPKGMLGHRSAGLPPKTPVPKPKALGPLVVGVPEKNRGLDTFTRYLPALLHSLGYQPEIRFLPFTAMLAEFREGKLAMVYKGDAPKYFDSASMFDTLVSTSNANVTGFANAELDRLIPAVEKASDDGKRSLLLEQLEAIVERERPIIPLFNRTLRVAYAERLELPSRFAMYLQQWDVPYHLFSWKTVGAR